MEIMEPVTLSRTNKQALLSKSSAVTLRRQAEAANLLDRLATLNDGVRGQLDAKQDAVYKLTLRMLGLRDPAAAVGTFIIISYCWHYPDWQRASAAQPTCKGWEISQPMVDAIMEQRNGDEGVWLDRLCIDQNNNEEKKVAVGAMDTVYLAARRLLILLEDVQLDADEEAAGLAYAGIYAGVCQDVREGGRKDLLEWYFEQREAGLAANGKEGDLTAAKSFVRKMLSARWYSRAWCAHESLMVSHSAVDNPLFL
jgi:hypothetical protein